MPVSFRVFPLQNLVVFTYVGHLRLQEPAEAVTASTLAPDYRPGMRHLVDLAAVTGVERDWPALLRQQAQIAAALMPAGPDQQVVFLAPTRTGQMLAQMARRSWDGLGRVRILILEDEAEALAILGLRERRIAELIPQA